MFFPIIPNYIQWYKVYLWVINEHVREELMMEARHVRCSEGLYFMSWHERTLTFCPTNELFMCLADCPT